MDLNSRMSLAFVIACFPTFWFLKAISLLAKKGKTEGVFGFFFLTPLISVDSWEKSKPRDHYDYLVILRKISFYILILCIVYSVEYKISNGFKTNLWLGGYLAAPMVFLIGECVSRFTQILSLLSGRMIPDHHLLPLLSRSLPEFWGKRWNTWVSDWFRQTVVPPLKKTPILALFFVFFLSGLGHELLFNLLFYFVSGRLIFGTMLAYFLIQFVGMWIDHLLFEKKDSEFRCVFAWLVIIIPCPLMLNEAVLRILHLWAFEFPI